MSIGTFITPEKISATPDFVPTHSTRSQNTARKVANGWEWGLDDGGREMTDSCSVQRTTRERSCRARHSIASVTQTP